MRFFFFKVFCWVWKATTVESYGFWVCALYMRNPQGNIAFVLCNPMQYESSASLMYKYYFWLMTWLIEILYHPSMRHVLNNFRYYRATALPTFVGYMFPLHVLSCPKVSSPKMIMRSFDKLTSNVRVLMEITFSVKQDTWQINWKIQTWKFAMLSLYVENMYI